MNIHSHQLDWPQEIWDDINQAIDEEVKKERTARKFLPLYGPLDSGTTEVNADIMDPVTGTVTPGRTIPVFEIYANFSVTEQQVKREQELGAVKTAARNWARAIAEAEDRRLYQGPNVGLPQGVNIRDGNVQRGLLDVPAGLTIDVNPKPQGGATWGENTYEEVENAIQELRARGHYGPYTLVLYPRQYVDTRRVLGVTLAKTSDLIEPIVDQFISSRTVPERVGLVASIGGNSMDLAVTIDAQIRFMQVLADGQYSFKVMERIALRIKRQDAVVRLIFKPQNP